MQKVRVFLFVSVLFFVSQPAYAEAYTVGVGASQCGKVLDVLEETPGNEGFIISWMQGYLSGLNLARSTHEAPSADLEGHEGQIRWVVNWCKENPLENFSIAVAYLFSELLDKQGANSPE